MTRFYGAGKPLTEIRNNEDTLVKIEIPKAERRNGLNSRLVYKASRADRFYYPAALFVRHPFPRRRCANRLC